MYLAIPKVCSREVIYCPKAKESPPWVDDCGVATSNPRTSSAPSQTSFWGVGSEGVSGSVGVLT